MRGGVPPLYQRTGRTGKDTINPNFREPTKKPAARAGASSSLASVHRRPGALLPLDAPVADRREYRAQGPAFGGQLICRMFGAIGVFDQFDDAMPAQPLQALAENVRGD